MAKAGEEAARLLYWPDARQRLLLNAAVGPLDRSEAAFEEWNAGTDWEGDIEPASYRLLPMIYARLRRLDSTHREMPRLRGIYRYSWCESQNRIRGAERAIRALNMADVPVMVSKGLALISAHYETPALRPMNDIDLYVPRGHLEAAITVLGAAGWRVTDPRADRGYRDMSILFASVTLWNDEWGELDLHWRLMANVLARPVMQRFWSRATERPIGRATAHVPAPGDLLMHVVAHGVLGNAMSPIRWIPDAVTILDAHGAAIDWPELMHFASRHWLAWRLTRGLRYVQELAGADIPRIATRYRPRPAEWIEHRLLLEKPGGRRGLLDNYVALALLTAKIARDDDRIHLPRLARQSMARRLAWLRP